MIRACASGKSGHGEDVETPGIVLPADFRTGGVGTVDAQRPQRGALRTFCTGLGRSRNASGMPEPSRGRR